jgi:hypothetical protein
MSKSLVLQIFLHGTDDASTLLSQGSVTQIDSTYFSADFKNSFAAAYQNQDYNVLQQNFNWGDNNGPTHQASDRKSVSNKLTTELRATLQKLKDQGKLPKDMRIALIGHSHGGNVAINGLRHLKDTAAMFGVKLTVDLYTINTPTYTNRVGEDYRMVTNGGYATAVPSRYVMNYEDPRRYINQANLGNNVTVNHFHAGVKGDVVVRAAGGGNSYGENGVTRGVTYNNTGLTGFKEHYGIPQLLNSSQSIDYLTKQVPNYLRSKPMTITQANNTNKVNQVRMA